MYTHKATRGVRNDPLSFLSPQGLVLMRALPICMPCHAMHAAEEEAQQGMARSSPLLSHGRSRWIG